MELRSNQITWLAILALLTVLGAATTALAKTISVDDDGPADFNNIQAAINAANGGDTILVADGTYRGNGNRDIDFKGKAITLRSENGPANCFIDCQGSASEPHLGFYFHSDEGPDSVLDGFTITNGYHEDAGAILCTYIPGGGESSPTITNCIITHNQGKYAGAIECRYRCEPEISNCIISNNIGEYRGGINYWGESQPVVSNCIIRGNSGQGGGGITTGGAHCYGTILNCLIVGNHSANLGGGIYWWSWGGSLTIINCTVADNLGMGGILIGGGGNVTGTITNCIVWGNRWEGSSFQIVLEDMTAEVTYCGVEGGWPGEGNIDADPLFVDADGLDNIAGTADDNLRLLGGSPCLDTGNNLAVPPSLTTDLDRNPRIINGIVDMGAYEGPKQGLVVIPRSVTVQEGATNSFTVALAMVPLGTVEAKVTVESGDSDIMVKSGATLIFDSSNYSQPQTVTLTAAEDEDYLNGTTSISVSSAGFNPVVVRATEADNENVIYVDADAGFPGADDGSNWADAFKYLQDALRVARSRDQILVAKGIYKPDQGAYQPPCERTATLQLISGVAIRGGYAGFGEPNPDARDIELYETILSGDLRGNDTDFNDSDWQHIFDFTADPNRTDNSYSVVTASGTDSTAVLDGFTITAGHANGRILGRWPEFDYRLAGGAGIYNVSGSPTVLNCTFLRNTTRSPYGCSGDGCPAEADAQAVAAAGGLYCSCTCSMVETCGAGMFNCKGSPTVRNCRFIENIAFGADAFSTGGAIFNADSSPTIVGCTFIGNLAEGFDSEYFGGAVYDCNSTTTYLDCSFIGNSAEEGGALFSDQNSTAALSRCVFAGNRAAHGGAAIHGSGTRLSLVNCTLAENRYYCTLACDHWQASSLNVANSILWDGGNEVSTSFSNVQITFSDIQGGWEGQGNINVDPCFAQAGYWDLHETPEHPDDDLWVNGDYHLRSQAGRWEPNDGRWTKDEVTSLCIDAGDPASPIGLEPFPNGGIINMGAYGGTPEASKSYFGEPVCETIIAGDINGDCKVNFTDFAIMAFHWLEDHNP